FEVFVVTSGSDSIATSGMDGTVRFWRLQGGTRPVADLVLLTELLSGQRTDSAGASVPLRSQSLIEIRKPLRSKWSQVWGGLSRVPCNRTTTCDCGAWSRPVSFAGPPTVALDPGRKNWYKLCNDASPISGVRHRGIAPRAHSGCPFGRGDRKTT